MRKIFILLFVLANLTFVQAQNSEKELIQNTEKAVKKSMIQLRGKAGKQKEPYHFY